MSKKMHIQLNVNGKDEEFLAEPRELLIYTLRERLNITGPHIGCETSHCGACTVTIDGKSGKACTMFVAQADGKDVTTIEGILGEDGVPHPIQQAWIEENVPQCGYCQSGQIMSALAMIKQREGNVTDEDIDRVMSANICRCGTYPRIQIGRAHV